jgi:hypothetical protein
MEKITVDQARARLAEIDAMAKRGDFSWSFDEYVILTQMVPEEKAAVEEAARRSERAAARRLTARRKRPTR